MQTNNNILLVANYTSDVGFAWSLMESLWATIASEFSSQDRKIHLVFSKVEGISEKLKNAPIQIHEFDFSVFRENKLDTIKTFINEYCIGHLYLTDYPYYHSGYISLRRWGVHNIINHDHTPGERPAITGIKRLSKKLLLSIPGICCDLYIGVSKFVRDRSISNACLPESRCTYILNGITPFAETESRSNYANTVFSIPDNTVLIVNTGRANYYKGVDFIIACANEILNNQKNTTVTFLFCGDGPHLNDFKKMAQSYNLDKHFIFAGYRNDIDKILMSADIAFHASEGEAFSLSILEYMSAGCVTIVPDNCGNHEAISNEVNGYLYPPKDLNAACSILNKLIGNPELRKTITLKAKENIREQFDIKRTESQLIDVLKPFFQTTS